METYLNFATYNEPSKSYISKTHGEEAMELDSINVSTKLNDAEELETQQLLENNSFINKGKRTTASSGYHKICV